MEYNKELIEHSLKIWGFDINRIELEKVRHTPMHQYKIVNFTYIILTTNVIFNILCK